MLQLPIDPLEAFVNKQPALREPLLEFVRQSESLGLGPGSQAPGGLSPSRACWQLSVTELIIVVLCRDGC